MTSLLLGSTEATRAVPDCGGPTKREKPRQPFETHGLNQQNSEVGKIKKSEVSHSSRYPSAAVQWIGEVEDENSIDDLFTSASITGDPILDFEKS